MRFSDDVRNDARDELTAMILANDRLLKAVLVLLSIKDEHLYQELHTVFAFARAKNSPIGEGSERVWDHVDRELKIIGDLAEQTDCGFGEH